MKLYGVNCRTAFFHPNWSSGTAGVRGTRILNNGRFFWELRISKRIFGTSIMFGVGTKSARIHADAFINLMGEDCNSWALSHKGLLWHGGRCYHYTKPFRENEPTTIGVLFDGVEGTLTYYKDSKCLGVAFRGLQDVKEPLYPMVCSTAAKTEVTLGDKKRDFANLQDRCRSVIAKQIKNKKELEKLMIPTSIKNYLAEVVGEHKPPPFNPWDYHYVSPSGYRVIF